MRGARELDWAIAERTRPAMIVSDNGAGFTSMATLHWSKERAVEWHYIAPGKPQQSGFIESFSFRELPLTAPSSAFRRDARFVDHKILKWD